jgi:transcriptional regulator with XRE-family HTH domain
MSSVKSENKDLTEVIEDLLRENIELKLALGNARTHARTIDNVTTREFAARCGVTPTQLSQWTSERIVTEPDFKD